MIGRVFMKSVKANRPLDMEVLKNIFRAYSDVEAVYLFGSQARGTQHAQSDIDLAVVPGSGDVRRQQLNILADLVMAGYSDVDLVILDCDDIVLKYEAVRDNALIYVREGFDPGAYYSLIVRQYLDFLPYLKLQREAYKRSVLDGSSRRAA